jgi:hypothetical protein
MSEKCDCCGVMVVYKDDGVCPSCQSSSAERAEVSKTGKSSRPKRARKKMQAVDVILLVVGVVLANFALWYLGKQFGSGPPVSIEEIERKRAEK